nr:M4 family metallopeptidase [Verrucomicrobium sp. BvORR034]
MYHGQSGALNESFSDIFGIFIKNWYPGEPNPLSGWTWTLGDGWRGAGTVLRDCIDPTLGGAVLGARTGPASRRK